MADNSDAAFAFIKDEVGAYWRKEKRALLLSTLGKRVRDKFPDFFEKHSDGLSRVIEVNHLAKVMVHPSIIQKIGAIPLDADASGDGTALFEAGASLRRPRLQSEFWTAFHNPVSEKRFVQLKDGRTLVSDVASAPSPSAIEILPSDLAADAPPGDRIKVTWQKIETWLKRNGLSYEAFADLEAEKNSVPRVFISHRDGADWAKALLNLSKQDQARILIPLDIVTKMLSSK